MARPKPDDETTPDEAQSETAATVEEPVDLLATATEHVEGLRPDDAPTDEAPEHVSGIAPGEAPESLSQDAANDPGRSDRGGERPPLVEVAAERYDRSQERMTTEETR